MPGVPKPASVEVAAGLGAAYPSAVVERVRDYASVKMMSSATPEQRFQLHKGALPQPVEGTTDIAKKLQEV